MSELVHLAVERGIAMVTLDSPANRNALSRQLVGELSAHLDTALGDATVRAVVLTHTGTVFCAGADLKEQRQPPPSDAGRVPPLPDVLTAIMAAPVPVVALLRGAARAGGIGLVAACDIAVAPTTATFAFSEVHIGVVPAMIAVPIIRRMQARAVSRWFLTGEVFDATAAAAAGLLTVAADDVDAAVAPILEGFRKAEPAALARTKAIVAELAGLDLPAGFALAGRVSGEFFASDAAKEGMTAFTEKRPPRWAV